MHLFNRAFEALTAPLPEAVFMLSKEGLVEALNPSACKLLSLPKQEIIGINIGSFVYDPKNKLREYLRLCLKNKEQIPGHITWQTGQDRLIESQCRGSVVYPDIEIKVPFILLYAEPNFSVSNKFIALNSTLEKLQTSNFKLKTKSEHLKKEIAERLKTEASLRLFKNLIDHSSDSIFVVEPSTGRILEVNEKGYLSLLYSREELLCMSVKDFAVLMPDDKSWEQHIQDIRVKGNMIMEDIHKRKDGVCFPVEVSVKYLSLPEGDYMIALCRDITERKRLQTQLYHAQKMEGLGQLAGGMAHDFNNMLNVITGYGSLLSAKLSDKDPLKKYVENILNAAEKSAALTQKILAFSRKQLIMPKEIDINKVVSDINALLFKVISEDIEIRTQLKDVPIYIRADQGQIEQAIMNLCINARDAMPSGGVLSIRTDLISLDRQDSSRLGLDGPGEYALIEIADTGIGIDETTRQRIFEPFFTTKEMGKGTGLGLSIVYGTVKQHRGSIICYSEPSRGSTFSVYIPALSNHSAKENPTIMKILRRTGKAVIMIAEDNETLRELTRNILQEQGFTVIEAQDGEEAIRKFSEHKDIIELSILDVVMPKRNGKEVFESIKTMKPDAQILFVSGYTADVILNKGIIEGNIDFIAKPFTPKALLSKVWEMLDRK